MASRTQGTPISSRPPRAPRSETSCARRFGNAAARSAQPTATNGQRDVRIPRRGHLGRKAPGENEAASGEGAPQDRTASPHLAPCEQETCRKGLGHRRRGAECEGDDTLDQGDGRGALPDGGVEVRNQPRHPERELDGAQAHAGLQGGEHDCSSREEHVNALERLDAMNETSGIGTSAHEGRSGCRPDAP